MTTWVPDSCTLPTAEQPLRVAEFAALFRGAEVDRLSPTRARVRVSDVDRARDLAARETECCSFFRFTFDGPWLEVTVPPERAEVLTGLLNLSDAAHPADAADAADAKPAAAEPAAAVASRGRWARVAGTGSGALGLIVACGACCLPLLVGAGFLTGAAAAALQNVFLGAAAVLLLAAGALFLLRQRRSPGSCGC